MNTQQSLCMTFTDLQGLATDSAGQMKMLQQAIHIKQLLKGAAPELKIASQQL